MRLGIALRLDITLLLGISRGRLIALWLAVSLLVISLLGLVSLVWCACGIGILGISVRLWITGVLGLILVVMLHISFLSAVAVIIRIRIEKL